MICRNIMIPVRGVGMAHIQVMATLGLISSPIYASTWLFVYSYVFRSFLSRLRSFGGFVRVECIVG